MVWWGIVKFCFLGEESMWVGFFVFVLGMGKEVGGILMRVGRGFCFIVKIVELVVSRGLYIFRLGFWFFTGVIYGI